MAKVYSNKSNAVRGFRTSFPDLADLSNGVIRMDLLEPVANGVVINTEAVADIRAERASVAKRPLVSKPTLVGVPMLRRSVEKGAVAKAHDLFAQLPAGTRRKDAIAFAVEQGIAFFTARTQFQRWSQAA